MAMFQKASSHSASGEHLEPQTFYERNGSGQVTGKKLLNATAEYPDAFLAAAAELQAAAARVS